MTQLAPSIASYPVLTPGGRDGTGRRRGPLTGERFQATVGRFDDDRLCRTIDQVAHWTEAAFRDDLARRPSKHVYVRKLPPEVVAQIDVIRDSAPILEAIRRQVAASSQVTPMKHTDELYVSHYNKDGGGDQGLFDKHYDGNLGFLMFVSVVRALIYLQSDASYTVVFDDSKMKWAFGTYEFGLLDFHRELHWVEGEYVPGSPQRILLKCNYLVAPPGAGAAVTLVLAANTAVFYVVKAAMEYSKSPKTLPQVLVGLICNGARRLNNVHPMLPLALAGAGMLAAGWGVMALLTWS